MTPHRRKQLRLCLLAAVGAAGALILLPLTLPVVLGLVLAALLDPLIVRLQKNTGMGRSASAGMCVSLTLLTLFGLLWLLGRILIHEAAGLSGKLPGMLETVSGYAGAAAAMLERLGQRLPDGVGDAIIAWGQELMSSGGTLAQSLYETIFSLVSRFLGALPSSLFFLMTFILAVYFAAGELPRIRDILRMHLPQRANRWLGTMGKSVRSALGGWFRAQLQLMGVTFLTLTMGFLLLRVDSPLLLALMVSLLDALPVFGTGTVLIPWALVAMMTGDMGLGLGLMGLYGAAALLRNILEPKVLGATLGLSPLLTLVAIYAGWRLAGLWGMIGLPMGAMVLSQLLATAREAQHAPQPGASAAGAGKLRMETADPGQNRKGF